MSQENRRTALVTGGSRGIGAATALCWRRMATMWPSPTATNGRERIV